MDIDSDVLDFLSPDRHTSNQEDDAVDIYFGLIDTLHGLITTNHQNILCNFCSTLDFQSLFHPSEFVREHFHIYASPSIPSCPFCRLVARTLFDDPVVDLRRLQQAHGNAVVRYEIAQEKLGSTGICRLWVSIKIGDVPLGSTLGKAHGIQMLAEEELKGRRVGKTQADLQIMKRWMRECERLHCCDVGTLDKDSHIRVIDVERGCIFDAPEGCRYLALSYVWGRAKTLQLTKATYPQLTRDGGLSTQVPATARDAMHLVKMLGEKYLWVDALCIIQDDKADTSIQISKMDTIYRCAILTIVAAAGNDANAGLPGVHPRSRWIQQVVGEVNGMDLISVRRPYLQALMKSTWSTRGWTFQEKILSARRLIFSDYQVFYQCDHTTWCEDTIFEFDDPSPYHEDPRWPSALAPFGRYMNLVEEYSWRTLSFEKDALDAFTGIFNILKPDLGEFIFGLPETAFHAALLWHFRFGEPAVRRMESNTPNGEVVVLHFPSWSWVGWKNRIEYQRLPVPLDICVTSEVVFHHWNSDRCIHTIPGIGHASTDVEDKMRAHLHHTKSSPDRYSTYLYFFAPSAHFLVDREPLPDQDPEFEPKFFAVRTISGHEATMIPLDGRWRAEKLDFLEFVGVSREAAWVNALLVEWSGDTAYRVCVTKFEEEMWRGAEPTPRFVVLG
jgi:hypothetical protein